MGVPLYWTLMILQRRPGKPDQMFTLTVPQTPATARERERNQSKNRIASSYSCTPILLFQCDDHRSILLDDPLMHEARLRIFCVTRDPCADSSFVSCAELQQNDIC